MSPVLRDIPIQLDSRPHTLTQSLTHVRLLDFSSFLKVPFLGFHRRRVAAVCQQPICTRCVSDMSGHSHSLRKPPPALNEFIQRDYGCICMASGWIAVCLTRINWRWHWGGRSVSVCISVCCHTRRRVCARTCVYVHLGMHTHMSVLLD